MSEKKLRRIGETGRGRRGGSLGMKIGSRYREGGRRKGGGEGRENV